MILRFHRAAHADVLNAATWYERKQSGLGAAFLSDVESAQRRITEDPDAGSLLEYPENPPGLRRLTLKRFAHILVYEVIGDVVYIIAVPHTSQAWTSWTERKRQ